MRHFHSSQFNSIQFQQHKHETNQKPSSPVEEVESSQAPHGRNCVLKVWTKRIPNIISENTFSVCSGCYSKHVKHFGSFRFGIGAVLMSFPRGFLLISTQKNCFTGMWVKVLRENWCSWGVWCVLAVAEIWELRKMISFSCKKVFMMSHSSANPKKNDFPCSIRIRIIPYIR